MDKEYLKQLEYNLDFFKKKSKPILTPAIDKPFEGTGFWFLQSEWSEWRPFFILWPRKFSNKSSEKWCWLSWIEVRNSKFSIQYRIPSNK